ncbi:hypothetical protein AB9F45_36295, partial [Rhizobium leguminosarum]
APEAEAAIDRADMDGLEQDTIGIALNDAFDGAMGMIADRIGAFFRGDRKFGCSGHEMVGPQGLGTLDAAEMQAAFDYIRSHEEIWEVILT